MSDPGVTTQLWEEISSSAQLFLSPDLHPRGGGWGSPAARSAPLGEEP